MLGGVLLGWSAGVILALLFDPAFRAVMRREETSTTPPAVLENRPPPQADSVTARSTPTAVSTTRIFTP